MSIKIQKDISYRAGDIPKFTRFHLGSMPTTRLTDIQKIQNYFEPVYQYLRNVLKKIQKGISSRTGDIPTFLDFSKEVCQLPD